MLLVVQDRQLLVCLTAICKTVRARPLACSVAMATRPESHGYTRFPGGVHLRGLRRLSHPQQDPRPAQPRHMIT